MIRVVVPYQYYFSNLGLINRAGDTMESIANSLGLSDVLRYLESLGSVLKGEKVGCFLQDLLMM